MYFLFLVFFSRIFYGIIEKNVETGGYVMRFTAYDIYELRDDQRSKLDIDGDEIYKNLFKYPKIDEEDSSFAPLYVDKYGEYVLGTLTQSYYKVMTKFEKRKDTKQEVQLEDTTINDKTYFYINCEENRIYVQGRRYPASLSNRLTIDRLENIIGECMQKRIIFEKSQIKYTVDEIDEIFSQSFVKRISFKELEGLTLPQDTILHNPRKDLDEALVESYNVYSAPILDTMELKAKDGEKLSKNPLAKIGMILSKSNRNKKIFKSMEIIDDGERVEIKPDGNEHKVFYVSKKDENDPYETYDRILKKSTHRYKGRFEE